MLDYGIHYEFSPLRSPVRRRHGDATMPPPWGLDAEVAGNVRLRDGHLHQRRPCTGMCLGDLVSASPRWHPLPHPGDGEGPQSYLNLAGEELMVGRRRRWPLARAERPARGGSAGLDGLRAAACGKRCGQGHHHWVIEPGRNAGGPPLLPPLFAAKHWTVNLRSTSTPTTMPSAPADLVLDATSW